MPVMAASVMELGIGEICLRLLCAMVVGLIIGTEREYTHRPAGMRTHILVALGSCAVMITGQLIFFQYRDFGATPDPARLSAQVITGVGFLGAGTILREGANVKGLTTAASLWSVACLGIAAGAGYYTVALAGMIFIFVTLTIFEALQKAMVHGSRSYREYSLDTTDVAAAISAINRLAEENSGEISGLRVQQLPGTCYRMEFRVEYGRGKGKLRRQRFFEGLVSETYITALKMIEDAAGVK